MEQYPDHQAAVAFARAAWVRQDAEDKNRALRVAAGRLGAVALPGALERQDAEDMARRGAVGRLGE